MTTSEATSASSTASSGAGILAIGPVIALVAISLASHFGMAFGTDKLVFSKPAYVDAKRKVESLEAQIEKLKLEIARANEAKQKALKATLKSAEETLASAKQIQQGLSMRAMLIQGVTQMVLFISLSSIFDGAPLVKLPFEPFSFLTG
jgi:Integral membrane protein EMC3/TMCO1-like